MKNTDVRIGNWYKYFDGTIDGYRYDQITLFDFGYISSADMDFKDCGFEPVELTEEILLKCGFDVFNKDYGEFIFNFIGFELYWNNDEGMFLESIGIEIKYLHQLQNLYYALTEQELTVKL